MGIWNVSFGNLNRVFPLFVGVHYPGDVLGGVAVANVPSERKNGFKLFSKTKRFKRRGIEACLIKKGWTVFTIQLFSISSLDLLFSPKKTPAETGN